MELGGQQLERKNIRKLGWDLRKLHYEDMLLAKDS